MKRGISALGIVIIMTLAIGVAFLVWWFLLGGRTSEDAIAVFRRIVETYVV